MPLSALIAELPPEKRALVLRSLRERQAARQIEAIPPRPSGAVVPLSPPQERLWLLTQILGNSAAYNVPVLIDHAGRINRTRLERAVNALVARHEALRTDFPLLDGHAVQRIAPTLLVPFRIADLRRLSKECGWEQAKLRIDAESRRNFDLAGEPLIRALLVRLKHKDLLLLVLHHMVADASSVNILLRELYRFRMALREGREPVLPVLPIQYGDYATWQARRLLEPDLKRQFEYWRHRLADLPRLEFPTNHPRPAVQTFNGNRVAVTLPAVFGGAIQKMAQDRRVTPFVVLLAAFKLLLARYSGQEDIVVGAPVEGRTRPELKDLIGLFVNSLVLRTDLSGDPTFHDLLDRVSETNQGALANQEIPFEHLVKEMRPNRDPSRNPMFQISFQLQNRKDRGPDDGGGAGESIEVDRGTSKLDLALELFRRGDRFYGRFEYNADLFDQPFIERMADHFQNLLQGALANPDERVSTLRLMTAEEQQSLAFRNDAPDILARIEHNTVLDLLAEHVRRTPDRTAVVSGDATLTYEELSRRSDRLAQILRRQGVVAGAIVVVALDRSEGVPVGLLGILKAGGAYLPVDPSGIPAERLRAIVEDARPVVILTNRQHEERLNEAGCPLLVLEDIGEEEADDGPGAALPPGPDPRDLAYVLYTSGSTGQPKGVRVAHRSLTNCLLSMAREPGIGPNDRLLAVTTLTFDIATLEMFLPLVAGAVVVIASRPSTADGRLLAECLDRHGITIMQATPATWRLLLAAGWQGRPSMTILCGGEALAWPLATALCSLSRALWNVYGPTETTIWSSAHRVHPDDGMALLSGPLANTQFHILGDNMMPVPERVTGELWIGGEGVALGYLNRPNLTAARFVPDPFTTRDGACLYRTGDLARFLGPGRIQLLGRADHQVKLRGYRIELGEIETIMRRFDGVADCIVLKSGDQDGNERLIAYVVATPGRTIDPAAARAFAKRFLPDYMCPGSVFTVPVFPLNASGKVDRAALAQLKPSSRRSGRTVSGTPVERQVAAAWCCVLQLDEVSRTDNFFDIGGSSLSLIQVAASLRERLGIDVPILELLRNPTIATLSAYLEEKLSRETVAPADLERRHHDDA